MFVMQNSLQHFPFLIMKIRKPKATALIYSSGKMICTGGNEKQSKLAARKYTRIIQKCGFPVKFKDFKIHGPRNVNFRRWLKGLIADSHGASSSVNLVDEVSQSIQQLTI
ncbi:TATA-box-binding protein 1 [Medicago truncatula]|uniref:TATA-box-binding protein 1 n=1 Tax=Medicago truncatula TaxID=3880 RepID=UPI001967BE1C|nr:TATA-box-binding protein 1 [Medicago truncatula]